MPAEREDLSLSAGRGGEKKVLFLIPYGSMSRAELDGYKAKYPDILFDSLSLYQHLPRLHELVTDKIKVLAGRGNNAMVLRRECPNVPVVDIQVTAYDVLRALPQGFSKPLAVVACGLEVLGLEFIAAQCGLRILDYTQTPIDQLERAIADAWERGARLLLGGTVTCLVAEQMGKDIPCILLGAGPESMRQAIGECRNMLAAIEAGQAEQEYMGRLMDAVEEGIVSIRGGIIKTVNASAEKFLGCERSYLVGNPVESLPHEFRQGSDGEDDVVVSFRGRNLLLRRAGRQDEPDACIFSLHEQQALMRMEGRMRAEMYDGSRRHARYTFNDICGMSPAISQTLKLARKYAADSSNILITGESGCGKELFAQSIHSASERRECPFVAVNCAEFAKEQLQSELFGYEDGAFTGAPRQGKAGIFEIAHGGTVFLDGISEMDPALQAALLRVLRERCVVRSGGHTAVPADVRLIAASNGSLSVMVAGGAFREDLYYRLNVLPLHIPPLRERGGDILHLMTLFLRRAAPGRRKFVLGEEASKLLLAYSWPGNVREVMNIARRIAATVTTTRISGAVIRKMLRARPAVRETARVVSEARSGRQRAQMDAIHQAILESGGNLSEAARRLGVARTTLWRRIRRIEQARP